MDRTTRCLSRRRTQGRQDAGTRPASSGVSYLRGGESAQIAMEADGTFGGTAIQTGLGIARTNAEKPFAGRLEAYGLAAAGVRRVGGGSVGDGGPRNCLAGESAGPGESDCQRAGGLARLCSGERNAGGCRFVRPAYRQAVV